MSAYFAQADLEARFTVERVAQIWSVQDSSGATTGVADATAIAATILDISATIDSKLGPVLAVPFIAPFDAIVVSICCDMAPYHSLRRRRPEFAADPVNAPFKTLHDDALKEIEAIRTAHDKIPGKALGNVGGSIDQQDDSSSTPMYFTRDTVAGTGGMGDY